MAKLPIIRRPNDADEAVAATDPNVIGLVDAINTLAHSAIDKKTDGLQVVAAAGQLMTSLAGIAAKYGDDMTAVEFPDGVLDRLTGQARAFALFATLEAAKREIE